MAFFLWSTVVCSILYIAIEANHHIKTRFYPRYHLAPPFGWMNDPNGFSVFQGEYHMFYQFNPKSSLRPGIAHWGHAKSKDLFHWDHLPIAMYPDKEYDRSGVFSGSALIENNTMYLYYTGNVNYPDESPDHKQHQALGISTDGLNVTKYKDNVVITAADHQPNIRDPKVWKHEDKYYMVLGNSYNNDSLGRILLYQSDDKFDWKEVTVLAESKGFLGYMWECPDFFELNGKFVLLFSPQGIKPEGDKYKNLYQTGYIVGDFDYDSYKFGPLTDFVELDKGHDFYATQTIEDSGRRLLVAWFDMWEQDYPERQDGWTGQLTLIRELTLTDSYKIIQKPVDEIKNIKGERLLSGKIEKNGVLLKDKTGEIHITADKTEDLEVIIESVDDSAKVLVKYEANSGYVLLNRGGNDGIRRTQWKPSGKIVNVTIYVDASSIEVFWGNGEITFSSRFFPKDDIKVRLSDDKKINNLTITALKRSVSP